MKKFNVICMFSLIIFACSGGEEIDGKNFVPSDIPEEEEDAGESGEYCSHPGSTVPCEDICEGGVRTCGDDNELGECDCGGSAGSPGQGGSSGEAGSAGQAGSGGSSGQAGSGGEAGSAGSGGSSGSAGQAGSGGSSGSAGTSGAGGSEPFSVECDQYGEAGRVVVYMQAPVLADHVLSLGGWINFPNWMGPNVDTHGSLWCWADYGQNKIVYEPRLDDGEIAEVVDGTKLIMWPGISPYTSSDSEQEQSSWFCEEDDCPVGTYVVCRGKNEVCAARNGELSGSMEYVESPWVNLSCLVE